MPLLTQLTPNERVARRHPFAVLTIKENVLSHRLGLISPIQRGEVDERMFASRVKSWSREAGVNM